MRAASKLPERPGRTTRTRDATLIAAAVVGALFLFPLAYLAWSTVVLGGDLWSTLFSSSTLAPLRNSVVLAVAVSATCAVLGFGLAWAETRTDAPGRRWWSWALPLPLVIPSFVGATALIAAFGPGGLVPFVPRIRGFLGAYLVLVLLTYPYVYLPVAARLRATPSSLEEAALVLDGGFWRTMRQVVYPQMKGTTAAGALLVFLYVLSDFGAVALMRYDTITRAIFSSRLGDRASSLTLGLILALLALAVASAERRVSGTDIDVPRSTAHPIRYQLGRARWWTTAAVALVVAIGFAAPVAVFVTWVLRGTVTIGTGYGGWGDDLSFLAAPVANSALAGVTAALVAALVVLPVAYAAARRRSWAADLASTSVASVFALPGLVVALAIVFWALQAPAALAGLYQTFPLLILAYVLHFGAQSMVTSRAAVDDLPTALSDAAHALGAGPTKRFVTIELPLIAPGLVAGAGLVLLSTLKELPATLLLAPIGFPTLATTIWGAAEDGFYAEVGVTSLVLIAMSWLLTWALILRGRTAINR